MAKACILIKITLRAIFHNIFFKIIIFLCSFTSEAFNLNTCVFVCLELKFAIKAQPSVVE